MGLFSAPTPRDEVASICTLGVAAIRNSALRGAGQCRPAWERLAREAYTPVPSYSVATVVARRKCNFRRTVGTSNLP